MPWITPFNANMDISLSIIEGRPGNPLIAMIQKIAIALVIPFAMIAFFEAVLKNLIFINLANLGITLLNAAHATYFKTPEPTPEVL